MPPPMRQHRSGRKWRTRQIIKGAAVLSFACFGTRCICCACTVLPLWKHQFCWFILKWIPFGMVICWAWDRILDSLGRCHSCCFMFSKSALEVDCACFLLCLGICNNCICKFCVSLQLSRLYLVSLCVCICNNSIWNLCVSLYLQQLYLKSLCVFVFATIVFGNDTGSLPTLAFDCRAAASSVDGTPEKKINVSLGKQRQHPRS